MGIRSIIALFLGLVLQLSQAGSCMATQPESQCAARAHAMSCCEGKNSCPCAKESRENEKPAPLLPASVDLKLLLSKAPEVPCLGTFLLPPAGTTVGLVTPVLFRSGYAGVPLSVAFCRFAI